MKNPTHSSRDMNQLQMKKEKPRERKKTFFVTFILSKGNFFNIWVLSQCIVSVLNKLSEYTYFYISKNITSYTLIPSATKVKQKQKWYWRTKNLYLKRSSFSYMG